MSLRQGTASAVPQLCAALQRPAIVFSNNRWVRRMTF